MSEPPVSVSPTAPTSQPDAPHGDPDELIIELGQLLSAHESADTRCVFKAGYDDLDGEDIARVVTIDERLARTAGAF